MSRDVTLDGPRGFPRSRALNPASRKLPPRRRQWSPFAATLRAHPAKTVAGAAFAALLVGIVANAAFLQRGHHSAPLFAGAPHETPQPAPARATDRADNLPQPRPAERPAAAPKPPVPEAPPPRTLDSADATKTTVKAAPTRRADGIGRLIRDGGKVLAPGVEKTPAKGPDPAVLSAQRALAKLGYAVKQDGQLGTATRQALEKFARDRHMAASVDGLSPKLLHALATAAGTPSG